MADAVGRWGRTEVMRRSAPFAGMILLGFATLPLTDTDPEGELIVAAVAVAAGLVAAVTFLPWARLPRPVTVIPPFLSLVIVVLLRHAENGAGSGYGILVLVPVLWLALYGTRLELIAMIAASALVFVVPILLFGSPEYPESEWRRAVLISALATFIGLVTQSLVAQARVRAEEVARAALRDREREVYLRTVMNSASEGIYALDGEGRSTFVNPAAAAMLSYSVDELLSGQMHDLVHHSYPDGSPYPVEDCPILRTRRMGLENVVSDEVFWRKDGTSFPVEYRSTPMIVKGEVCGVVVMFTDISERLEVERMKNEFISVVSHELRTPLTSIRGSLGLMEGGVLGELSEEAKQMLSIAISNADRLVRLINDILDVERIDSGKAPMELRPCELAALMESTCELLSQSAEEAGVELEVRPVEAQLVADPDRIIQTLVNLVGNAIKFSPRGATVTVEGAVSDGRARVYVRDQGRGIPAEQRETIFDRFAQVETADARQKGGSGLGLAIARGIVEQHGGRIWVESTEGEGSTFAFELPIARGKPAQTEVADGGERLGALVVEDDSDLAQILVKSLQNRGVIASHVSDVGDAVDVLRDRSPEIIVLDLILPGADGEEVIDWLRDHDRLGESAIVVYTARDLSSSELTELRKVGEVVTKSRVTPKEFEARLMATIQQSRRKDD